MHLITTPTPSTPEPAPIEWVEKLFEVMAACYGARFLDMWRGANMENVKAQWAAEMGKLSRDELRRGHAALMTRDLPPTLPVFIKLCKPELNVEAAFHEAVAGMQARERGEPGTWSSPSVYWAAVKVGAFDMRTLPYSVLIGRWKTALEALLSHGPCADIPAPAKSLPAPGNAFLSPIEASRRLAELNASGILARKRDPRAWVGKVLRRIKDKDDTLPGIAVRLAQEVEGKS